jgi:hypothetical protein
MQERQGIFFERPVERIHLPDPAEVTSDKLRKRSEIHFKRKINEQKTTFRNRLLFCIFQPGHSWGPQHQELPDQGLRAADQGAE